MNVGPVTVTASQAFFPTQVAAHGALLRDGNHLSFTLRLVNTISGELKGVVYLPDGTTPAGAGVEVNATGPLPDVTVSTDADGRYRFAKIFPEGTYHVTVRDPVTGGVGNEQIYMKAGQDAVHDLRLKGRGAVRVRVVNGGGVPVSSAFVRLAESSYPFRTYEGAVDAANQGVVTFGHVFEGPFNVEASDVLARGGRTHSVMPGPEQTVDVTVRLTVTGTVRGRFFMPDRTTLVPFASVRLIANNRVLGQFATRGGADAGSFEFTYVPAGDVRVEATNPVTARTGVAVGRLFTQNQPLVLDIFAQGVGTVQGVVTSNGLPHPVHAYHNRVGRFRAGTYTDSEGKYIVVGVPEGRIAATADLVGGVLVGTASATLAGDGNTLTLNVALRDSGTVTGQVFEFDGLTPAPPSLVSIRIGGAGGGTEQTTTDNEGRFRFERVAAGLATVGVDVLGSINQGHTSAQVAGNATTDVPVTLNGLGPLTGHALDSNGAPVEGDVTVTGTGMFQVPLHDPHRDRRRVPAAAGAGWTCHAGPACRGRRIPVVRHRIGRGRPGEIDATGHADEDRRQPAGHRHGHGPRAAVGRRHAGGRHERDRAAQWRQRIGPRPVARRWPVYRRRCAARRLQCVRRQSDDRRRGARGRLRAHCQRPDRRPRILSCSTTRRCPSPRSISPTAPWTWILAGTFTSRSPMRRPGR